MARFDAATTATVIGVAGFQLLQAWNNNAPSLAELRSCHPDDISIRQKLYDADFMVGGLATVLGVVFAILAHDTTALLVMLVIFGGVSMWHHSVLNAESR
jgi:hypothetical protein